jgi:hypothetical protein
MELETTIKRKVVIKQNRNLAFELLGEKYFGVEDLFPPDGSIVFEQFKYDIYEDKRGNFILRRTERHQTSDFYERTNEERYYRNYFVCESKEECMKKFNFITSNQLRCKEIKELPEYLTPFIYADDALRIITLVR